MGSVRQFVSTVISRTIICGLIFGLIFVHATYAGSTVLYQFVKLRDASGLTVTTDCLWALVAASPGEPLPGGLEQDSSLTEEDITIARAAFGGANITPGSNIGSAVIIATGLLDEAEINETIVLTDQDYETIQPGSLIGLYWFPGIQSTTSELPESNFSIGGFQETAADESLNADIGMVVPNEGQTLTCPYFDSSFYNDSTFPPERFTAINVPPSGYQIWRDTTFTQIQIDTGDAAPTADPDKDGWLNLLEYATTSPPLDANISPLTLTRVDNTVELEFSRIADEELNYRIEATQDLNSSPWPAVVFESSGVENIEELVTHSEPLGPGERFFRLSVQSIVE